MSIRTVLALLLLTLAATAGFPMAKSVDTDPRVQAALDQLDSTRKILAEITDEQQLSIWQQRVRAAEAEVENAKRLVALERREESLLTQQRKNSDYALREMLLTVETNTEEPARQLKGLDATIRRLKAERLQLELRQPQKPADTDEESAARAEREQRLLNLDAEIQARVFERDTAELRLRLAGDAKQIEQYMHAVELNPRATIRLGIEKWRTISTARKTADDYRVLVDYLKARRDETQAGLALSRERLTHIDTEIGNLQNMYSAEGKSVPSGAEDKAAKADRLRRVRNMLSSAKSEKSMLAERIKRQEEQVAALEASVMLAGQAHQLRLQEVAFMSNDLALFRGKLVRQLLLPIAIIFIILALHWFISRAILPMMVEKDSLFIARRLENYLVGVVILVVLVMFLLEDLKSIATVMGIAGAAVVIALQDLCSSFAGWFVIVASRKIKVGDRVEIEGHRGDVIDLQLLRITLLEVNNWLGVDEPTGRVVIIPNSFIFKSHIFNYTHVHPYISRKIDITVTFESPLKETHDLLLKALEEETKSEYEASLKGDHEMERHYGVSNTIAKPHIMSVIADSGVQFSLFYCAHYKRSTVTRDQINARIMQELEKHPKIQLAYPTQRHIPTPTGDGFPVKMSR